MVVSNICNCLEFPKELYLVQRIVIQMIAKSTVNFTPSHVHLPTLRPVHCKIGLAKCNKKYIYVVHGTF